MDQEYDSGDNYRVTIDLVKRYAVYVHAENEAEAAERGKERLEAGEGALVDDFYADDRLKVEKMRKYKATQTVTYTYEHYMKAADNDEAMVYAERQFNAVRHKSAEAAQVVDHPIKLEWLE